MPARIDPSVAAVIVTGKGGNGALAVARTLGRWGVAVYLISEQAPASLTASRYWRKCFEWDMEAPNEALQLLYAVGKEAGTRPILLAISDTAALFIEDNAAALDAHFRFPKPAPGAIRMLSNKWEMFLAAKAHGIPTPEATYPHSRAEVIAFLDHARFPIMMKGADQRKANAKVKDIVRTREELLEKYDRAEAEGGANFVLQEYIPGGDDSVWMCNGYFAAGGKCLGTFAGRKLRQAPPHAGIATLAVVQPNAIVEAQTRAFMLAAGYEGLVGIGWRYDARDGQYKVLDVNARISAVFRLFRATNGMDVVRMCYLDLTGQPVPEAPPSPGRKWLLEEDFMTSLRYARRGELTFGQWVRSLRGVREAHWFALDDPLPLLAWLWTKCSRMMAQLARNAGGYFRQLFHVILGRRRLLQDFPPNRKQAEI